MLDWLDRILDFLALTFFPTDDWKESIPFLVVFTVLFALLSIGCFLLIVAACLL